ncbi:MAG: citramalate synthase [Anaerolineaceae bacterium]|nr:citramalate synthase [Anaerolineaceae bacterium]
MKKLSLYDTTLRDGAQSEGVSFSLDDKLMIARRLDQLGVDYIEGGFPLSNPKDQALFSELAGRPLPHARLAAFGMTRRADSAAGQDAGLNALLSSETAVCTVVGKAWEFHVTEALRVSLDENLKMIADSISYLKDHDREVVFDAEHYFDGHKANSDYALKCLRAAAEAGADWLVLCDTNGGSLPQEIEPAVKEVVEQFDLPVGIHTHNDSGLAVAGTIVAVQAGCAQVQGTINGLGERCGNADLCTCIANLQLKLGRDVLPADSMVHLTEISRLVYEICNMNLVANQPYVGTSAFAHKGGMHASAMARNTRSYEHITPDQVGNTRRILISELAGASNVVSKALKFNVQDDRQLMARLRNKVQKLENEGYQFEAAEASFEMLLRREIGLTDNFFELESYQLNIRKTNGNEPVTVATLKVRIKGQVEHHVAEGDGPVNALDAALRKSLLGYYPNLATVSLTDYKVRVINSQAATAAKVRVIIESKDADEHWGTVGVSENIIDASWMALIDSIEYKLLKDREAAADQ